MKAKVCSAAFKLGSKNAGPFKFLDEVHEENEHLAMACVIAPPEELWVICSFDNFPSSCTKKESIFFLLIMYQFEYKKLIQIYLHN